MINDFSRGAGYLLKGFALLNQPGVKRYVIIPLLINMLLFAGLIWLSWDQFSVFNDWLAQLLPDWLAWLTWLLKIIFFLLAILLVFFSFTLVANLVGAPFNSYLAAAVEFHLTGQKPAGGNLNLLAEFSKTIKSEISKILYALLWLIPLLIITMIPGLNLVSPVLWAWYGAWMLALEYSDYPLGNHGYHFADIRATLRQRRWLALGFGGAATLATMIPLVNFFVMPMAVAGATRMRIEQIHITEHT